MATMADKRGQTQLFVSGQEGIFGYTVRGALDKNYDPTALCSDILFQQCQRLVCIQDGDQYNFWALSRDGTLGYQPCNNRLGVMWGQYVLVLPPGQTSTGFTVAVSCPDSGYQGQTLVSNDSAGNLSMITQFADTGLWNSQPIYYNSPSHNIKIPSYHISLKAIDSRGRQAPNGSTAKISASSCTPAIINGKISTLSAAGDRLSFDATGQLAIIIPTTTISCPTISVSELQDSKRSDLGAALIDIDPSMIILDRIGEKLAANSDLSTIQTQTGQPLCDQGQDTTQLTQVSDGIRQLHEASKQLRGQPAPPKAHGQQDLLSQTWHYITETAEEAVSFVLKTIGKSILAVLPDVLTVVEEGFALIIDEGKSFVIDTIEKVGSAFTWVCAMRAKPGMCD
jgi:hypothetical protein